MNVLAFDTCYGACSVAVRWRSERGEWLLREDYRTLEKGHAELLLPMIEAVMVGAGVRFSDLSRIAVTTGPGSFTGVRIGLAAARGLALAAGLPIVGMTSLAVMAHRADLLLGARGSTLRREHHRMLVAVDMRRNQYAVQLFGESVAAPLFEPALLTPEEALARVGDQPLITVGSGAAAIAEAASRQGRTVVAALADLQPHARQLAILAEALRPEPAIKPIYLRPPDARPQGRGMVRSP